MRKYYEPWEHFKKEHKDAHERLGEDAELTGNNLKTARMDIK